MIQTTSKEAFDSVDTSRIQARVRDLIDRIGGCTCDQAMSLLQLTHQSCSPAFTALKKLEAIRDSGRRAPTRTGRNAIVWVASQPETLFPELPASKSEMKNRLIRAALEARAGGSWTKFDATWAEFQRNFK